MELSRRAFVSTVALSALALAGCGGSGDGKTEIKGTVGEVVEKCQEITDSKAEVVVTVTGKISDPLETERDGKKIVEVLVLEDGSDSSSARVVDASFTDPNKPLLEKLVAGNELTITGDLDASQIGDDIININDCVLV